jgi:hypothetical protein
MGSNRILENSAEFIWRDARLLERRLFQHLFLGGPREVVTAAVMAYRHDDGGFGQALEPDVRATSSQPLFCEIALRALHAAGIRNADLAIRTANYLATVAESSGRVPIVLPDIVKYPRAPHWSDPAFDGDSPNPTAALVGLLRYQEASHEWLDRAGAWCWRRLEQPIQEAHEIACALTFLEFECDRERARPDSIARAAFSDDPIAAHLDDLIGRQQSDGGWPISWTAPSAAAAMEWRGMVTLESLIRLRAYGRI